MKKIVVLKENQKVISLICLLASMAVIQGGASLAKNLFPLIGPEGTTSLRLIFSALILLIIFKPWKTSVTRAQIKILIAYGLFLGGMNFLFYLAIARIPLGIAVALEFTGPLFLALISSKKTVDFVWVFLAVAGLMCLLPFEDLSQPLDSVGMVLALAAGACWAGYILAGQKISHVMNAGTAVSMGMLVAAFVFAPFGLWKSGSLLFSWNVIPLGVGVALLSSALPYTLEMIALKGLSRPTFSILMSLEPVFATLSGYILLSEKLTWLQLLAIAFVMVASLGSSFTSKNVSA